MKELAGDQAANAMRVRALAVGIAKAWVDQQKSEAAEESDEPEPVREKRAKNEKLSPVGS